MNPFRGHKNDFLVQKRSVQYSIPGSDYRQPSQKSAQLVNYSTN